MINKYKLIEILEQLLLEADKVKKTAKKNVWDIYYIDSGTFNAWRDKLLTIISNSSIDIPDIVKTVKDLDSDNPQSILSLQESINGIIDICKIEDFDDKKPVESNGELEIENIFNRFHSLTRQLRARYDNRETLNIKDEYDVQDLLHVLLSLYFDDVRQEEWTPSYAGGASRMDFLLKDKKIVIETKMTRKSLTQKQLGSELIEDREKYKEHSDCNKLYFFIYDPDGYIRNPKGLESDLEKNNEDFLKVIIKP